MYQILCWTTKRGRQEAKEMITIKEKRQSSRDVRVGEWFAVSVTVNQRPWLVLQRSAARQALMHCASSRNHLIIYCTDRQRAVR